MFFSLFFSCTILQLLIVVDMLPVRRKLHNILCTPSFCSPDGTIVLYHAFRHGTVWDLTFLSHLSSQTQIRPLYTCGSLALGKTCIKEFFYSLLLSEISHFRPFNRCCVFNHVQDNEILHYINFNFFQTLNIKDVVYLNWL